LFETCLKNKRKKSFLSYFNKINSPNYFCLIIDFAKLPASTIVFGFFGGVRVIEDAPPSILIGEF